MFRSGDWHTLVSVVIILAGAAILLVSIVKLKVLFAATPFIPERNRPFIVRALNAEKLLLFFFLAGYLVVAGTFVLDLAIIGKVFVALVFLLGAVFVWTASSLTARILSEIQATLQGLLPICLSCKKIRMKGSDPADQEGWIQIESFISRKTEARFSHGLCPACLAVARGKNRRATGEGQG